MNKQLILGVFTVFIVGILAACGGNNETATVGEESNPMQGIDPSSSGEVPDDLQDAEDPTYQVGDEAIIDAGHVEGMDGAVATIDGAYDTTVYEVTHTPTDGGPKIESHKWIIHEEIENAQNDPYDRGDKVVLEADHMEGMEGAVATINKTKSTTIYMISYTDTKTQEKVQYHKWVIGDELSPLE